MPFPTPQAMPAAVLAITSERDIVLARQAGRELAARHGFGLTDQTRLATAISEIVRNVVLYAGRGQCRISAEADALPGGRRIVVVISDQGPGIADLDRAMEYGFTTGNGLGAGLPGTRRLMDSFDIVTGPQGTTVTMAIRGR